MNRICECGHTDVAHYGGLYHRYCEVRVDKGPLFGESPCGCLNFVEKPAPETPPADVAIERLLRDQARALGAQYEYRINPSPEQILRDIHAAAGHYRERYGPSAHPVTVRLAPAIYEEISRVEGEFAVDSDPDVIIVPRED